MLASAPVSPGLDLTTRRAEALCDHVMPALHSTSQISDIAEQAPSVTRGTSALHG